MNGRNIIALAMALPGVSQVSAPQMFTGDRSGPTLSISGSEATRTCSCSTALKFNAVFRNTGLNFPPPDALQEVMVLTNSFGAEYGRNAGSIFNVVSKSGTNEIHGAAWEFLRNHRLNAVNRFAPPGPKPQLIQNQFGATAGGPIRKDRLFVFGSYEGLRVRPAALSTGGFPLTAAERAGSFTSPIRDPLGGTFPDNQVPAARFDTVSRNILTRDLMPLPNQPSGQFSTTFPTPQNDEQFLGAAARRFRPGSEPAPGAVSSARCPRCHIGELIVIEVLLPHRKFPP